MALHHVLGQDHALRLLHHALAHARLSHAYLFAGSSGVGKHFTARQLTKTLYCVAASTDACDTCVACHKIDTDNHPDVVDIGPDGASIGIEHIRAVQHRLSYKPYENQRITIILDACESLTPPAANALLKTLEEPPAHGLLLLLTSNQAALPLTLISRCQRVPFRALASIHIRTILEQQGVDQDTAALASMLSQGGLRLGEHGDVSHALAARQQAQAVLTEVIRADPTSVFIQARQLAGKREQCEELLQWLAFLCRDLVMLNIAPGRPLYNDDLRHELSPLAHRLSVDPLLDACAFIEQLRRYLGMNLNPQLVFERLLIHLHDLVAPPYR